MENKQRGQFGSSFGFIMAAVGSAVGLGIYGDSRTRWVRAEVSRFSSSI